MCFSYIETAGGINDNLGLSDSEAEPLNDTNITFWKLLTQTFNFRRLKEPCKLSERTVAVQIFVYCMYILFKIKCCLVQSVF